MPTALQRARAIGRVAAVGLLLCCTSSHATPLPDPEEAAYPALERFVEVLEQVRRRHPDTDKLSYDRLIDSALEGMLGSLDAHSSFIHPEMAEAVAEDPELDPYVASLGLTLGLRDSGPYFARLAPDSAADSLPVGAALVEIDGLAVAGLPFATLLNQLRGAAGAPVELTIRPPQGGPLQSHRLVHRAVNRRAVADSKIFDDATTGYVRLSSFTDAAPRELSLALDELEDAGMQRLILDLRGNPGGSLPATVEILGLFLPPETEVVTTRGRQMQTEHLSTPARRRRQRDYPLAVLVDRGSASASELTAGALQDLERAVVVGETTYGKGSVQNIVPTGHGTALRLTVATYHTPSGDTPHRVGIQPDVKVSLSDAQRRQTALAFRRDRLTPTELKSLSNWKDPVLMAAEKALAASQE